MSFHKEVLLGSYLAAGLKKEGIASFSAEEREVNLPHFTPLCKGDMVKAEDINTLYTSLFASYKARGANPQKYIENATKFIEKFNEYTYLA